MPVAVAAASAGLGYGIALASGLRLRALLVPAGFLAGIVLSAALFYAGIAGTPAVVILVLAALAGPVYGWVTGRRPRSLLRADDGRERLWAAAAGIGGFAAAMAPIVGNGRSGVMGYVFNDDSAIHIALIQAISDGHTEPFDVQHDSYGFGSAALDSGYPLGSYMWPVFGRLVGGIDPFHIWSPLAAVVLGLLALVAYDMLRRLGAGRVYAAVAAAIVPLGHLVFAYHTQGGMKEVISPLAVFATAALVTRALDAGASPRTLFPAALAGVAGVFDLGFAAVGWIGPLAAATVALVIWRVVRGAALANPRRLLIFGIVAVVLALPVVISGRQYLLDSENDLTDPAEVGNLFDAISPWQMLNVWLTGDWRFKPTEHPGFAYTALVLAGLLAIAGLVQAARKRDLTLPLALGAGVIGMLLITPRVSIYYDAKTYVVIAPALGIATAAGAVLLWSRRRALRLVALAATGTVAVGVLWSAIMIYTYVWFTPKERLGELVTVAERFEGAENILSADREQYAFHLLHEIGPWDDWGYRQPGRGLRLPDNRPPPPPRAPDLDDYTHEHIQLFGLILERRSPGGSRAPANFEPAFETKHYRVWRRTGPAPREHMPFGSDTLDGVEASVPLACRRGGPTDGQVTALAERAERAGLPLVASVDPDPPVLAVGHDGWYTSDSERAVPAPNTAAGRNGGAGVKPKADPGRYEAWIHGSFGPGIRLWRGFPGEPGTIEVGDVFNDLGLPGWHRVGEVELRSGDELHVGMIGRRRPLAGSRGYNVLAGLKLVRVGVQKRVETVPAGDVERLCGRAVDWLEIPSRP